METREVEPIDLEVPDGAAPIPEEHDIRFESVEVGEEIGLGKVEVQMVDGGVAIAFQMRLSVLDPDILNWLNQNDLTLEYVETEDNPFVPDGGGPVVRLWRQAYP